ncbi:MAG: hypothetical protein AB7U43_12830, partial [Desulfobacter sp.]
MRQSSKKEENKLPPFVGLTWELLNSKAYKELTPSAAKAAPYFYGKARAKGPNANRASGIFEFSYEEATRFGFAKRTFARVITELVSKGLVDMAGYGGLRGNCKTTNKFRL